jgi:hypothetical protein
MENKKKRTAGREPDVKSYLDGGLGRNPTIEDVQRDGLPAFADEILKAVYGFSDWRLALCLAAERPESKSENAAIQQLISSAVQRRDGNELRAFAKCFDALAENDCVSRARAMGLYFCENYFRKAGRKPDQATVRAYIAKSFPELAHTDSTMRKNEARDIFYGPVLGSLPRARGGRKKPPSTQ